MGMMLRRNIKARAAKKAALAKPKVETKVETKENKVETKETKVETKAEETEEKTEGYTAEDIQKMPYMKLKSVAKQNDVAVEDREASEVRAELITKLGL